MPFDLDSAQLPPPASPRARIGAALARLGPDELELVATICDRLSLGRQVYGELRLRTDDRDFRAEAFEEFVDGSLYLAAAMLRSRS